MTFGQRLRLWLTLNKPLMAVLVLLLLGGGLWFALVGGMTWLVLPRGPSERVEGVVRNFGSVETDQGSYRVMVVDTADGRFTVPARIERGCRVGSRAVLNRTRIRFGLSHSLEACPSASSPAAA